VQEIKWVDQCQEIKDVLAARCSILMREYFVHVVLIELEKVLGMERKGSPSDIKWSRIIIIL